jgi:ligand-binding sensor domain-containing protein
MNGTAWIVAGIRDGSWNYSFNPNGFNRFENGWWTNYNEFTHPILETITDFVDIAIDADADKVYLASYRRGLAELHEESIFIWDETNSGLQTAQGDPNSVRVGGIALDTAGNLWIANTYAIEPVVVKTVTGEWYSYPLTGSSVTIGPLVIDGAGHKWFITRNSGLIVYDDNGTIETAADDDFMQLTTGPGSGNLPAGEVYSLAVDRNGQLWVGTNEGIAVFYCPEQVFDNPTCADAQQIIVEEDGIPGYLLETESITALAVDGANRKWVGTNNGVWLLSDDGLEEVLYFNSDNSPLFSNQVRTIAIDHQSGDVFIGTNLGVQVYGGDATKGSEVQTDSVMVFPNPVMPGYEGTIAINGLVEDAEVHITDVSGALVYRTIANGGTAVWNGKTLEGNRPQSGVYLVLSSNSRGTQTIVAKLVFFN